MLALPGFILPMLIGNGGLVFLGPASGRNGFVVSGQARLYDFVAAKPRRFFLP
jgi:hypothetical protein